MPNEFVGSPVPLALTGATSATRYVGGTASVAPTTGTFAVGDFVIAQNGNVFVCTVAGSPGTWVNAGSSGAVSSVFTRTGAVVAVNGDYMGVVSAALTGATGQATRYVGGNASGAPLSGTFAVGDFVINADGSLWICTTLGTPGTWTQVVAGSVASGAITNAMVAAGAAIAVTKIAAGLAGQVLQGTGPSYAYPPGFEIAYDQTTSTVAVVSTTEGTPTAVIAGTSHTYEAVPYLIEFSCAAAVYPSTTAGLIVVLAMVDGASVGRIAYGENDITGGQSTTPMVGHLRYTPTAAAHTIGASAYVSSTTGTPQLTAGAGGAGTFTPVFVRVTKA